MNIEVNNFKFRRIKYEDAKALYGIFSEEESLKQEYRESMEFNDIEYLINEIFFTYEQEFSTIYRVVENVENGDLVAYTRIDFNDAENTIATITGHIALAYRNKKIGYQLVSLIVEYLKEKGVVKINASCDMENSFAIKILEKLSFEKEAHIRKSLIFKEEYRDVVSYGIVNN